MSLDFTPRMLPSWERVFSWESQASQYAVTGNPGIGYERHYADGTDTGPTNPVDCLLYRHHTGELLGIFNYYPEGDVTGLVEQPGNFNIWVHPEARRRGIATELITEARKRWPINFAQQRYTAEGLALITTILCCSETEHR